ncbi:hypothetical protein ACFL17_07170 [Pseudomonadota bacterium]
MKTLYLLALVLILAGCGGGSSGGGGVAPGNFIGPVNVRLTGPGGSTSYRAQAVLTVNANGTLQLSVLAAPGGGATSCTGVQPVSLNGNNFSYTDTYSCLFSGLGRCRIVESGQGFFNGNVAQASITGTVSCPGGTVAVAASFTGTRQGARAVKNSDNSGAFKEALGL